MTPNLWDAAKAVLRGKYITTQSYLKKQETSQINSLTLHLEQLENEEQKKPQNQKQAHRNRKQTGGCRGRGMYSMTTIVNNTVLHT